MPQLWSGVGTMAKKNKRFIWPDLIQTLSLVATIVQCAHGTLNVQCPWHYLKLSAPGTCNDQCPWHYHFSLCSCQHPIEWVLVSPLFLGFQPILGMIWELPIWLWGSSWSSCSPWEQSGSWLHRLQCPLLLTGQSPPALLWCVMVWCTAQCQPHCKCHMFTAVLFLREINFCTASCIGCQLANMC